jgi:hypothetical protein
MRNGSGAGGVWLQRRGMACWPATPIHVVVAHAMGKPCSLTRGAHGVERLCQIKCLVRYGNHFGKANGRRRGTILVAQSRGPCEGSWAQGTARNMGFHTHLIFF